MRVFDSPQPERKYKFLSEIKGAFMIKNINLELRQTQQKPTNKVSLSLKETITSNNETPLAQFLSMRYE